MALQTLRSMAGGGIYDQVGGGFARYSVDATLDRAALREDALRQRAARARLPARLPGQRRRAAAAHRRGDARLGAARDARARGRLLQRARRRLRGRRGQVLRLDASTSCAPRSGDDADAAIAWFGATERGNFEGANVLESRGPEPPRRAARRGSARGCSRSAPQRVRPGLDDKRLAAWNALMIAALADAGAVLGRDGLPRRRARRGGVRARRACARPTAACCAPSTPATARLDAYLEDHAFLLEALLVALRGDLRGALVRRGARAGRHDRRALRRPRARRLLLDLRRPRGARRPAQGPRGLADPVGRARAPRSACCASRRSPASARYEEQARWRSSRCCTRSRRATRGAFGHLLQALDFHLAPRREVALAGDPAGVAALAAVVREALPAAPRARRPGRATGRPRCRSWSGRAPVDGRAAAYVCERFACRTPVTEPDELRAVLARCPSPSAAASADDCGGGRCAARRRARGGVARAGRRRAHGGDRHDGRATSSGRWSWQRRRSSPPRLQVVSVTRGLAAAAPPVRRVSFTGRRPTPAACRRIDARCRRSPLRPRHAARAGARRRSFTAAASDTLSAAAEHEPSSHAAVGRCRSTGACGRLRATFAGAARRAGRDARGHQRLQIDQRACRRTIEAALRREALASAVAQLV